LPSQSIKTEESIIPPQSTPQTIQVEMTPQLYNAIKEAHLSKHPLRSHIETYFEWLKTISPEEAVDYIEMGKTLKEAYDRAPYKWRLAIATARGILKSAPKYREQFKSIVNDLDLALTTLKFENPITYQIIQQYDERGREFVKQCQKEALIIFGIEKETTKTD